MMRGVGYALAALAMVACSSRSGDVTVYPLLCSESLHDGDCRGQWLLLSRTVYRVSADQQAVSYWTPGTQTPKELAKCVVSDTANWHCSDPDGSAEKGMTSGEFTIHIGNYAGSDVDKEYQTRTRYVSPLQYWIAWFRSWLKPPSEY
jgi:hypothetical protein